jgi:hypothetical protein
MANTTNYAFKRPTIGGAANTWGNDLNDNWGSVDTNLKTVSDTASAALVKSSNLDDLADAAAARTNLALGSIATEASTDYVKTDTENTFTVDQTFGAVTETVTTKEASFAPTLATDGTIYLCSNTITITMPAVEAGKSFTVIHSTADTLSWYGTIKWNLGSAPVHSTGIDIFCFISDGVSWYGVQTGTGFA